MYYSGNRFHGDWSKGKNGRRQESQLGCELSYDPKILKIGNVIKQESEKERNSYDFQNNSRNRSFPKFKKNS